MKVNSTCSHRALAGQPQEAFLLQDETGSDEHAGAERQGQADVEVLAVPLHLSPGDNSRCRDNTSYHRGTGFL